MKSAPPAEIHCQCGCGRVVTQPRTGGPRKRFYEGACRARWARRGKTATSIRPASPDDRYRILERIYAELEADIRERGTMVGGRVNPAVEMLRKIGIELDRRAPVIEQEESDEDLGLVAV
jgi:hypothetical protein